MKKSFGIPHIRAPRPHMPRGGGKPSAFGAGGSQAFSDPQTMQAPDQAFSAAMAMPGGGEPMPSSEE